MFYKQIHKYYQKMNEQITSIQSRLDTLPPGKLLCVRNGKYRKFYLSHGGKQTYIAKSRRSFLASMAAKKYLSLQIKDLLVEKKALEFYFKHYKEASKPYDSLLETSSDYYPLLKNHFASFSNELTHWINAPFEQNQNYPEQLIHHTFSGHLVRSKSEELIDTALTLSHIPFRYECALTLNDITLFPDFTLLHPQTKEIYYWEHFGLMDNPEYSQNAFSKLKLYIANGILPSDHLILTFETSTNPLDSEKIEKIIQLYFS